ncbi:hypothetical protein GCM10011611_02540 [Aliidongia dinghuensis]|uniref:Uncharacterized protein n=1 Tax=Aliidongia dinghuensis TaxID=1867774 RepID=A0A8J3E1J5_9PROT|nr:hypothetical protein GCM10011611_02540 [Aliidongia dinghuensis]
MVGEVIEYVRYAFDEEGPHINPGRIVTFIKGMDVQAKPSALTKFGKYFLEPFLQQSELIGWREAGQQNSNEYIDYIKTFRLNGRPIILELAERLHGIGVRFT